MEELFNAQDLVVGREAGARTLIWRTQREAPICCARTSAWWAVAGAVVDFALVHTLSLACSVTSFAFMIYTRHRVRVHGERMRAYAESGVAHRDETDAVYRDRHFITMRSA